MAKGFRGRAKNCWTVASNKVEKSLQHAYVGRKQKKRDFRTLWIQQVGGSRTLTCGCVARQCCACNWSRAARSWDPVSLRPLQRIVSPCSVMVVHTVVRGWLSRVGLGFRDRQ